MRGYCTGLSALVRKTRKEEQTDNEYALMLHQALKRAGQAHLRLQNAHEIRSDDVAENGLAVLCERHHNL